MNGTMNNLLQSSRAKIECSLTGFLSIPLICYGQKLAIKESLSQAYRGWDVGGESYHGVSQHQTH